MLSVLDDAKTYSQLDPTGFGHRLHTFSDQCMQAWRQVREFKLPDEYDGVSRVLFLGVGGSAISGDLLMDLASLEKTIPMSVHRDYGLPSFVDDKTLVLAMSYSGNTAETISGCLNGITCGAKLVVITSGGRLAEEAQRADIPCFKIDYQGEPRSAMGFTALACLGLLVNVGILSDKDVDLRDAVRSLTDLVKRSIGPEVPSAENHAKKIAISLKGKLPVIYAGGFFRGVGYRWKTQLNENSKVWAQFEALPEANHNSVNGYELPVELKHLVRVILLQPEPLHPSLAFRYELTGQLLRSVGVDCEFVKGQGDTPLTQMLTTILLGDYVSYYLALLQGLNPSETRYIDLIKNQLES